MSDVTSKRPNGPPLHLDEGAFNPSGTLDLEIMDIDVMVDPITSRYPAGPPPTELLVQTGKNPVRHLSLPPPLPGKGVSAERKQTARQQLAQLEQELLIATDPVKMGRLHYEIARLSEFPLQDLRGALLHYQDALSYWGDYIPSIRGARRLLIMGGHYQSALELFDKEIKVTSDLQDKVRLYIQKGHLLEDWLEDFQGASQAYGLGIALDHSHLEALRSQLMLSYRLRDWKLNAQCCERLAKALTDTPNAQAVFLYLKARVSESRLSDPREALQLYENARIADVNLIEATASVKRLYHGAGRWRDLIQVMKQEAALQHDPNGRAAILFQTAELEIQKTGALDEALNSLEDALKYAPRDPFVLDNLSRLYERLGKLSELSHTLERLAELATDTTTRVHMLHRLGVLHETQLKQNDGAIRWYDQALKIEPSHIPSLQALGKIYTKSQSWQALIAMHISEAEHARDSNRRAAAYARVAELYEHSLNDARSACEFHLRVLTLEPQHTVSFKALERLYASLKRFADLAALLERGATEAKSSEEMITNLLKAGAVFEDLLDDPSQAIATYKRVLDVQPHHTVAIHALQRAAERAGRFLDLVSALEFEAQQASDTRRAVALYQRAGEVLDERLGDRDGAMLRFRKALQLDPQFVPALAALGRLFYRLGRWEDLLGTYYQELDVLGHTPAAIGLLVKMAELCESHLGRSEEALDLYRRAVSQDPYATSVLQSLEQRLYAKSQWREWSEVILQQLSATQDPKSKAFLFFRLGTVQEHHLADHGSAAQSYQHALEFNPTFTPAAEALMWLRSERGEWSVLAHELEVEASSQIRPEEGILRWHQAAFVWLDRLEQTDRAQLALQSACAFRPLYGSSSVVLEALYRHGKSWPELTELLRAQIQDTHDISTKHLLIVELVRLGRKHHTLEDSEIISLLGSLSNQPGMMPLAIEILGDIAFEKSQEELLMSVDRQASTLEMDSALSAFFATRLGEGLEHVSPQEALFAFRTALSAEPENIGANRGLMRLSQSLNEPNILVESLRREAFSTTSVERAANLLVQSATISAEQLDQKEQALDDLERALELNPSNMDAHALISKLLLNNKEYTRLIEILSRAAMATSSKQTQVFLWHSVARVYETQLGQIVHAIGALNRALKHAPEDLQTLWRLSELYRKDRQWTEALQLLGRVIQLAQDARLLCDAHLELASISDEKLGNVPQAITSLKAALALDPQNLRGLEKLTHLYQKEMAFDLASGIAQRWLEAGTTREGKAAALYALGQIHLEQGNLQQARDMFMQNVSLVGAPGEGADALKRLARGPSDWVQLGQGLEIFLRNHPTDTSALETSYVTLTMIQFEVLEAPEIAFSTLHAGLASLGDRILLCRTLGQLHARCGHHRDAANAFRQVLQLDIQDLEAWQALALSLEKTNAFEATAIVSSACTALGLAFPASGQPPVPGIRLSSRPLHTNAWHRNLLSHTLFPNSDSHALGNLISVLGEVSSKLYPPDLEAFGVSSRDKVTSKSGHSVRLLADRIAAVLGTGEFDLYLHRVRGVHARIELTDTPSLMLPAGIVEAKPAQQAFVIAELLIKLTVGIQLIDKVTPRELDMLLSGMVRAPVMARESMLPARQDTSEHVGQLSRLLSRKHKKEIEDISGKLSPGHAFDTLRWLREARSRIRAIACVLAGDLGAVLSFISVDNNTEAAEFQRFGSDPVARELIAFWVSDTAFVLRKHLYGVTASGSKMGA